MIFNDEAELMYPVPPSFRSLDGLGGLGCGNDSSCGCGCKSNLSGLGDITDRSDFGLSLCNWTPLRFTPMCSVPSTEDIIKDTSDYGGQLSPENRAIAEGMAQKAIVDDCRANPGSYTEVPGSCSYNSPMLGIVLLVIGGFLIVRG